MPIDINLEPLIQEQGGTLKGVADNGDAIVQSADGRNTTITMKELADWKKVKPEELNVSYNTPDSAFAVSPLSPVQRAAFGWMRTPKNQQDFLEESFGKDNVKLTGHDTEDGKFSVKVGKAWHQVDPGFSWDLKGIKEGIGDAAQFAGRYGARIGGAMGGELVGGLMGSAGGPIGMAVGGVLGSGAGGGVGEAIDIATHQMDGHPIAESPQDAAKRIGYGILFGLEQGVGGLAMKGIAAGAGKIFSKLTGAVGDTGEAMLAKAKLAVSATGGGPEMLPYMKAAFSNTERMDNYLSIAANDLANDSSNLTKLQVAKTNELFDGVVSAQKQAGAEIGAIESKAKNYKFNADGIAGKFEDDLVNGQFKFKNTDGTTTFNVDPLSNIVPKTVSEAEKTAIQDISSQFKKVEANPTLSNLRNVYDNIGGLFEGDSPIKSPQLTKILAQSKADLKNRIVQGMEANNPQLAVEWGQKIDKYGDAADLQTAMSGKVGPERVQTFINKMIKNGTYQSNLAQQVSELMGVENPTHDILRMEAAKKLAADVSPGFNPLKGRWVPGGLKGTYDVQSTMNKIGDGWDTFAQQSQATKQAYNLISKMGSSAKTLLTNPDAVDLMQKIVGQHLTDDMARIFSANKLSSGAMEKDDATHQTILPVGQ